MKKVISTTLILTDREADTLSDAIDILHEMAQMLDPTDTEGQEKVAKAVDAFEALWYSDFVDME